MLRFQKPVPAESSRGQSSAVPDQADSAAERGERLRASGGLDHIEGKLRQHQYPRRHQLLHLPRPRRGDHEPELQANRGLLRGFGKVHDDGDQLGSSVSGKRSRCEIHPVRLMRGHLQVLSNRCAVPHRRQTDRDGGPGHPVPAARALLHDRFNRLVHSHRNRPACALLLTDAKEPI